MVFSRHVYESAAKLKNQLTADAKQGLWALQFWQMFSEREMRIVNFVLPFPSYGHLRTSEITIGRSVWNIFWKRRLLRFIISCASWPLENVSKSWTNIPGYGIIILASIRCNYREGGGFVAVWPATLQSFERCIEVLSMPIIKCRAVKINAGEQAGLRRRMYRMYISR